MVKRGSVGIALVVATACGGAPGTPLSPTAGDLKDDGAGALAQASIHLRTGSDGDDAGFGRDVNDGRDPRRRLRGRYTLPASGVYGGAAYGGDPYGGLAYGGATYANWVPPQFQYSPRTHAPDYQVVANATGVIEGKVTWAGALPGKLKAPCGTIDNPTLHVGPDRAARGVLVYIEHVAQGRLIPYYTRPVSVGGAVAKRGCTLVPAVSMIAPLPGPISVHGDETPTKIRIFPDKGAASVHALQEGGLVQLDAQAGVTRIDSDDGMLSAAWVVGVDTPYVTLTDDAGRYRLTELPAGTYEVTFWQPPVASIGANGSWSYGPAVVVRRSVTVGSTPVPLSAVLAPSR